MRAGGAARPRLPGEDGAPRMQKVLQDWEEEHSGSATHLLRGLGPGAAPLRASVSPLRSERMVPERTRMGRGGGGARGGVVRRSQSGEDRGRALPEVVQSEGVIGWTPSGPGGGWGGVRGVRTAETRDTERDGERPPEKDR